MAGFRNRPTRMLKETDKWESSCIIPGAYKFRTYYAVIQRRLVRATNICSRILKKYAGARSGDPGGSRADIVLFNANSKVGVWFVCPSTHLLSALTRTANKPKTKWPPFFPSIIRTFYCPVWLALDSGQTNRGERAHVALLEGVKNHENYPGSNGLNFEINIHFNSMVKCLFWLLATAERVYFPLTCKS